MAIGTLSTTFGASATIQAANALAGSNLGSVGNNSSPSKKVSLGTAAANAVAAGADEAFSVVTTVPPSSSVNIDLTSLTDILNVAGVTLARLKSFMLQLLSAADDGVNGTAASCVTIDGTVTNGFAGQGNSGWFGNATSKLDLPNGCAYAFICANAGGVLVDGTHKLIKLTNVDAALSARTQFTGAGGTT
jgi:hypothetical protein